MDNNPQNLASQALRPPTIGSIGSQSFGTNYSMQFRPAVSAQPGQPYMQSASGAQQYRPMGQPQMPQFSQPMQPMQQRPGQPGHLSSSSQPPMSYMQPPQFQNSANTNSHVPSLGGPSYTFNAPSFGQPTNVSSQFHGVSQTQPPVVSTGGQPWMSSGNQGPLNVTPVPQTGQQPSTITPSNQASSASQDAAADWQEFTANDGRRYYYNKKTKQSSWDKPLELMTPLERADASTVWKEFTTAEGKKYYYNKDTKQSKWTIPDELKLAREHAEKEASRGTQSPATLTPSTLDQLSASVSSSNDVSSPVVFTPVILAADVAGSSSGCAARGSKRKRGACKNLNLEKALEKNGGDPLPISFDIDDQRTYGPVGQNASMFKSLVGSLVRNVPLYHDSWERVPADKKDHLWPTIERYFDMQPYLDRPKNDPVRKGVTNGVHAYCAERYRGAKYHFKNKWFTKRGGPKAIQEIRAQPPPNMDIQEWGRHVNCYMSEGALHRSEVNTENRALQQYIGTQGRKSFAEIRHDVRERTGEYPTLISTFADTHMRNGTYVDMLAQQQHEQMQQLWDAQRSSPNPMTEEEIMDQVLGTRGGHHRGRGRIVRDSLSETSIGSQGRGGRWYSKEEVEQMEAQMEARLRSQLLTQMEAQMEARLRAQMQEQMQTMFDQHLKSQGFNVQPPVPPPQPNPIPHLSPFDLNDEEEDDED